jgi:hypothetical protein
LQPCSPGFVDGRDAILAADVALYGGANECLIWEAFSKRGLGFSASQGSSGSKSDGTEAFDKPSSCSFPQLDFLASMNTRTEGGGSEQSPSGNACTPYSDYSVPVSLSLDPSNPAIVIVSINAGTAENFIDYELLTSSLVFSSAGTQNVNYRIYNDANAETTEELTLGLTISNAGSTNAILGQDECIVSIYDNEMQPGDGIAANIIDADFESGANGFTSQNSGGDDWVTGTNTQASSTYWSVPSNGSSQLFYVNDDDCNCNMSDVKLLTPVLDLTPYLAAEIQFDIFFEGNTYLGNTETADLMISTNGGTSFTQLTNIAGNASWHTLTFDLSAYVGNANIKLAFKYGDGGGWLYGMCIDNVILTGDLSFDPLAGSNLTGIKTVEITPNADVYIYNDSDDILARIQNGAHDLGCVDVELDRTGSGATAFWSTNASEFVADKTFLISPDNNSPTASYSVTLYYSNTEKNGWETATGKSWDTQAKVIKHSTAISDVTPANPLPNGPGSIEQIVNSAGQSSFNPNTHFIKADFSTGFSGFGVGDPVQAPLPLNWLSFTGNHVTGVGNSLKWVCINEIKTHYFDIERSSDGVSFEKIGEVNALNIPGQNEYQFLDRSAISGINHYRLRQFDLDGHFSFSKVISISVPSQKSTIKIYPNPVGDMLTVDSEQIRPRIGEIFIMDITGKVHANYLISEMKNDELLISVNDLKPGLYYLHWIFPNHSDPDIVSFIKIN